MGIGVITKTAGGWKWAIASAEQLANHENCRIAHEAAVELSQGLIKLGAEDKRQPKRLSAKERYDAGDDYNQLREGYNFKNRPLHNQRNADLLAADPNAKLKRFKALKPEPFHPVNKSVKHLHNMGKGGPFVQTEQWKNDGATGYSAQAWAAAEIYSKVNTLKKELQQMANQASKSLKMVVETINSAAESFETRTAPDDEKPFEAQGMLGVAIAKLQKTVPPDTKNLASVYQWCLAVESGLKPGISSLNRAQTPEGQNEALKHMHQRLKPDSVFTTGTPSTDVEKPAEQIYAEAGSNRMVKVASNGNWIWQLSSQGKQPVRTAEGVGRIYKLAKDDDEKTSPLQNFEDRNIWNAKIDDLKQITVALVKMSKLVFQTGTVTRQNLRQIMASKRLSPYPQVEQLIEKADKLCLDSPHRVAEICKVAANELVKRVNTLEAERKEFVHKNLPGKTKYKGWLHRD